MKNAETFMQTLLAQAGIQINGTHPWDIQVHNQKLYNRIFAQGSLGLGEAYMDGWWDVAQLDQFFTRVLAAGLEKNISHNLAVIWAGLKARLLNQQNQVKAFEIGRSHYDIGNDLYTAMLDSRLTYSCGYWKQANTLDEAQAAKLDLICRKLNLQPSQRVLDIGCGWGSFLKFAAERYGIRGVGITVSKEQQTLANTLCQGLPIEIRLQDYRAVHEQFDQVVSIGMFEHVGWKNYRRYMKTVRRCLTDSGLFLLQTIGGNASVRQTEPWIEKYIFRNSMLPSVAQIGSAIEHIFVMEDWQNFGADYDRTLLAWWHNFDRAWPKLQNQYGDRFYRMWKYYLLACAASFRSRKNQLWQIVLSSNGIAGGYHRI